MDISLTEEQQMLRTTLARFFADKFPSTVARQGEHDLGAGPGSPPERGWLPDVWRGLVEMGILQVTIPDSAGGAGMGQRGAAVVAEEMGRALYQGPYGDTLTAADLIEGAGPDGPHWPLLGRIAAGERTVALALRHSGGQAPTDAPPAGAPDLEPAPDGVDAGWRMSGRRRFVAFGRHVDNILLLARAAQGPTLAMIPRDRDGITIRRSDDLGRGEFCVLEFEATPIAPEDIVGNPGEAMGPLAAALSRARLRQAAYLVGIAQAALDMTVKYGKERQQFGKRIAGFQSISFRLAALAARIDAARLLTWRTAWQGDRGDDIRRPAAETLALAGDLARDVTAESLQVHGSFGMTEEADPQRYYRRAAVESMVLGTPNGLRREAATLLVDESGQGGSE